MFFLWSCHRQCSVSKEMTSQTVLRSVIHFNIMNLITAHEKDQMI